MGNSNRPLCRLLVAAYVISQALTVVGRVPEGAQEAETTRKLWDTAYVDKYKSGKVSSRARASRRYKVVTQDVSPQGVSGDTVLGVTIWRLRPTTLADRGERLLEHEAGAPDEWIPERVLSNTKFSEGDRVRLSFEAARAGFLYVIDREQYGDGTLGKAYLIFPTTRTRGGNNEVGVGRIVEVPAQTDKPPYFKFKRGRADQIGEVLTVIVSPSPIEGLQASDNAQQIDPGQVENWERQWGGRAGRLEMENGPGKPWTSAEKVAGADPTRSLGADEPGPQTIYYRPAADSSSPVAVNVRLSYRNARASARGRR